MRARTLVEGCGIGIALTFNYTWGHLSPRHIDDLYLRMLPVNSVIGGALVDLLAASAVAAALIVLLDKFDAGCKTPLWAAIMAIIPAVLIRTVFTVMEMGNHGLSSTVMFAALFLPCLVLWIASKKSYRLVVSGFRWAMAGLGVCMVWMAPRLMYMYVERQPQDIASFHRTVSAGNPQTQPRVVWILLDELSYDQTFEHRQPGLSLPNFDALHTASTSFSDVQPAGYFTDEIIPGVLRGKAVAAERSGPDGLLFVSSGGNEGWERFDPQATVFGDARRLGWTTGIAGWFNPYCRVFAAVADSCSWFAASDTFRGHMSRRNTVLQNAFAPLRSKAANSIDTSEFAEHRAAYPVMMANSLALLRDSSIRFVFLHLPVPHPPGMYDRARHRIRNGGSYLDNLALADVALGELRAAIEASPAARNTTLVVSSDHSMRVPKWRGGLYWSAEDERVFHGRFDTRPVLLIHFAGEGEQRGVGSAFDELRTHDLLEEMLRGRMNSTADLDRWLAANHIAR
jgi:hypothetical protein